jgi:class 3 adenylate cyclase
MKAIPFVNKVINKNYPSYDEEHRRIVSVIILLVFMMIFVMSIWSMLFWFLKMPEMLYLDIAVLIGFIGLFMSILWFKISYKTSRFIALFFGTLITAIPVLYYGIDTIVTVHLVFLAMATILMFSRNEKQLFLKYLGGILAVFIFVVFWSLYYGQLYTVEPKTFRIFNTIVAFDTMFIALYYTYFFFSENTQFKDQLTEEREKSDTLLLSIFPESIANHFRNSSISIADSFENVTIIFADIVGFTEYSNRMNASELVQMLDEVFSEFDALVDKYGIEKIKTIGDSYMAVGGLPNPHHKHCHKVADLALEITEVIKTKFADNYKIKMRIGIHTGKAVAGVIGNKKFAYDLWGDSVNIASRFEASGQPEKVHVSEDVRIILGDDYHFEECGEIEIKGKGLMKSFFLLEKKVTSPNF